GLQKCDTDYEPEAEKWFSQVLQELSINSKDDEKILEIAPIAKRPTTKHSYSGTIITNINLNDTGSDKQTHHIEIAADDVDYLPGDSLGLIPENPAWIIDSILSVLDCDPVKKVLYKNEEYALCDLLKKKLNVIFLAERVVNKYGAIVNQEIPATKIGLADLLKIYPLSHHDQLSKLIEILEPITPRLYSIASSPEAHSGEIHLTVARDKYYINDELKYGLCSDYFSQIEVGTTINFYIHKNSQFRLPEDNKDIIMVGPGTGIAPFRSYVAHRDATGAEGKNWLFFGDRQFVTDFLYQSEWQNWLQTGVLTKMDVAFSRDQKEKVYVQHKMIRNGKEIFEWLENGAYFYICGAREPMSVDVENTLLYIIHQQGNKTTEESLNYLETLKEEGRFLKDVY
ncbi:MAG TPA: sulfite reductase, partial [Flavisolibacter sp.]|nr:sulfite reductase [Flavisolibacter sp.]